MRSQIGQPMRKREGMMRRGIRNGVLRAPDEQFASLPGAFAFRPVASTCRARWARRALCRRRGRAMRRSCSCCAWRADRSFLYRELIGPIVAAGYRAVAPDMIGFPVGPTSRWRARTTASIASPLDPRWSRRSTSDASTSSARIGAGRSGREFSRMLPGASRVPVAASHAPPELRGHRRVAWRLAR